MINFTSPCSPYTSRGGAMKLSQQKILPKQKRMFFFVELDIVPVVQLRETNICPASSCSHGYFVVQPDPRRYAFLICQKIRIRVHISDVKIVEFSLRNFFRSCKRNFIGSLSLRANTRKMRV